MKKKRISKKLLDTDVLRIPEVARRLRIHPCSAYILARKGVIPSLKLGGSVRVPRVAFERFLTNSER